jgi:hypothetical protein
VRAQENTERAQISLVKALTALVNSCNSQATAAAFSRFNKDGSLDLYLTPHLVEQASEFVRALDGVESEPPDLPGLGLFAGHASAFDLLRESSKENGTEGGLQRRAS